MGGCLTSAILSLGAAIAPITPGEQHERAPAAAPVLLATSLGGRIWRMNPGEPRLEQAIAQRHALPELLGRLLAVRGVGIEQVADHLNPTLRALLPDPSSLRDMDHAAERLARAVVHGETVGVLGDYDVDGACSTALLLLLLRRLGCTVHSHVPDRTSEGYGPNFPALNKLASRGCTLIVCVDCGTAAFEPFQDFGHRADLLVLDHHQCDVVPREPLAVVNPNRPGDGSGLGHLCATAIAFLTAIATLRVLRLQGFFAAGTAPDLMQLLDLVALATVCDVMPLTGLNRAFVAQGLRIMAASPRPGIAALLAAAGAAPPLTAATCGFALGPRINAGGRIGQADAGLNLLLEVDPIDATGMAQALDAINRKRQELETIMLEKALRLAALQLQQGHAVLMVAAAQWHVGVAGIVAGRLKERFNRPACVAACADGLLRGSGRSVPGLDLGRVVDAARREGIIQTGGGHAMACGFTLAESALGRFHTFLDHHLQRAASLPAAPDLCIDATLSPAGATLDLARLIQRLAPFGQGNPEPVLLLDQCRIGHVERVGREQDTLRLQIDTARDQPRLKAMLFRAADTPLARQLMDPLGPPLRLAGNLRAESWNGRSTPSFTVIDGAMHAPAG